MTNFNEAIFSLAKRIAINEPENLRIAFKFLKVSLERTINSKDSDILFGLIEVMYYIVENVSEEERIHYFDPILEVMHALKRLPAENGEMYGIIIEAMEIIVQIETISSEEIEQMKRDAEAHAEDDRTRREGVEVRNQADSLAYTAEKTMSEAGDKIPADVRADIDARVKDIRDGLSSDASSETLRSAVEALSEALQKAGSAVYGEGAEGAGAGVGAETGAPDGEGEGGDEEDDAEEGTVEGEYREV